MVNVLPQTQQTEDCILAANFSVAITPVLWLVVLSESEETVWLNASRRHRLWRKGPKQLRAVMNLSVVISIEDQKCIIGTRGCPGYEAFCAVSAQIEPNTARPIRTIEAITCDIN